MNLPYLTKTKKSGIEIVNHKIPCKEDEKNGRGKKSKNQLKRKFLKKFANFKKIGREWVSI